MKRADRSAASAVLLAALILALAVPGVGWRLGMPDPGFSFQKGEGEPAVVTEVFDRGTAAEVGLRAGDTLLAVGDLRVPEEAEHVPLWSFYQDIRNDFRAGEVVEWRVVRNGREAALVGPMVGEPRGLVASHLVVYGVFWVIAFFLLWARRELVTVRHIVFTVLALTAGQLFRLNTDMAVTTPLGFTLQQASTVGRFLGPALVVHFGLIFPVRSLGRRARRRILGLAYGIPFLLFLVEEGLVFRGLLSPATDYNVNTPLLESLYYWDVRYWVFVGSFLACGLLMLHTYRRVPGGKSRAQIKWVLWSVLFAAGIDALVTGIALYVHGSYPEYTLGPVRYALYLLPAVGLLLAVFRHDLFDVDAVIRNSVIYFGTTALLFVVFAATEELVTELVSGVLPGRSGWVGSATGAVLAGALFEPVRGWIRARMEALLPVAEAGEARAGEA